MASVWRERNASERVRSFLAVFTLLAAFPVAFLAWHWLDAGPADKMTTAVFSFVTLVFGFYFGRQGVDEARAQAENATQREAEVEESVGKFESEMRSQFAATLDVLTRLEGERARFDARLEEALADEVAGDDK